MASLVDQIFAQAQLGTAVSPDANPFATGVQLGQNQQRISLAERQLAAEVAMQPLRQTLMLQDAAMNEAKLTTFLEDRQNLVANQQAYQQLTGQVSSLLASGDPKSAEASIWDAISRNRGLDRVPGVKVLLEDVRNSLAGKVQVQQLKEKEDFIPSIVEAVDPTTGNRVPIVRNSRTSGSVLRPPEGTITRVNPDGSMEVIQGPIQDPGILTRANQTKVQEKLAGSLQLIATGKALLPLISTETVGVQAFAENFLKDRLLAQRFPQFASEKRANAQVIVSQLRADAVKELGTPPISDKERAEILKSVPGVNEALDSPANATRMVEQLMKASAKRALLDSKRLGVDIPASAAALLTNEDLLELFNAGLITHEMARRSAELRIQSLRTNAQSNP